MRPVYLAAFLVPTWAGFYAALPQLENGWVFMGLLACCVASAIVCGVAIGAK